MYFSNVFILYLWKSPVTFSRNYWHVYHSFFCFNNSFFHWQWLMCWAWSDILTEVEKLLITDGFSSEFYTWVGDWRLVIHRKNCEGSEWASPHSCTQQMLLLLIQDTCFLDSTRFYNQTCSETSGGEWRNYFGKKWINIDQGQSGWDKKSEDKKREKEWEESWSSWFYFHSTISGL